MDETMLSPIPRTPPMSPTIRNTLLEAYILVIVSHLSGLSRRGELGWNIVQGEAQSGWLAYLLGVSREDERSSWTWMVLGLIAALSLKSMGVW